MYKLIYAAKQVSVVVCFSKIVVHMIQLVEQIVGIIFGAIQKLI
jgi:hypothetical protein